MAYLKQYIGKVNSVISETKIGTPIDKTSIVKPADPDTSTTTSDNKGYTDIMNKCQIYEGCGMYFDYDYVYEEKSCLISSLDEYNYREKKSKIYDDDTRSQTLKNKLSLSDEFFKENVMAFIKTHHCRVNSISTDVTSVNVSETGMINISVELGYPAEYVTELASDEYVCVVIPRNLLPKGTVPTLNTSIKHVKKYDTVTTTVTSIPKEPVTNSTETSDNKGYTDIMNKCQIYEGHKMYFSHKEKSILISSLDEYDYRMSKARTSYLDDIWDQNLKDKLGLSDEFFKENIMAFIDTNSLRVNGVSTEVTSVKVSKTGIIDISVEFIHPELETELACDEYVCVVIPRNLLPKGTVPTLNTSIKHVKKYDTVTTTVTLIPKEPFVTYPVITSEPVITTTVLE